MMELVLVVLFFLLFINVALATLYSAKGKEADHLFNQLYTKHGDDFVIAVGVAVAVLFLLGWIFYKSLAVQVILATVDIALIVVSYLDHVKKNWRAKA